MASVPAWQPLAAERSLKPVGPRVAPSCRPDSTPLFSRSRTLSGAHADPSSQPSTHSRRVGRVLGPRRFRTLQASRTRARSGPLKVTWAPHDGDFLCVAYAIPTSVGNAVQRNTVRRRLRDAVAAHATSVPSGDVLVRVAAPAEQCTWVALSAAVADTMARICRIAPVSDGSTVPVGSALPVVSNVRVASAAAAGSTL